MTDATMPGALSGSTDLHRIGDYEAIRRRYLRIGLIVALFVFVSSLTDSEVPLAVQGVRIAVATFCAACLWWMKRGGDGPRLRQLTVVSLSLGILLVAVLRSWSGWPPNLGSIPVLVVFTALVVDTESAASVAFFAIVAVVARYLLATDEPPPFLMVQITNWALAVVLLYLFVQRLSDVLASGADELSRSTVALDAAHEDATRLTRVLTDRVAADLAALDHALREEPRTAEPAAARIAMALDESRRSIAPEPVMAERAFGDQFEALRLQAMDWTLQVMTVLIALVALRNATVGPVENLPITLVQLGAIVALAVLRRLRPGWRPTINVVLLVTMYVTATAVLWEWFALTPFAPPIFPLWLSGCLLVSVTLGIRAAFVALGVFVVVCLVALEFHPGVSWLLVMNMTLAYGTACTLVRVLPRDLLAALERRRSDATVRIGERRRLVSTLLHDLANPLSVVADSVEQIALGSETAEAIAIARTMVARMQATLTAAVRGGVDARPLDAGRLIDELELLFREPLRRKGITLRRSAPIGVKLVADEALLRDSVLANLLSNALRFSPNGGTIDLGVRQEAGRVAFVLEDRGPGLPAEVLSAGASSTGFGLLLARDYLAAMGGSLELLPREGGGLSVRAWLGSGITTR